MCLGLEKPFLLHICSFSHFCLFIQQPGWYVTIHIANVPRAFMGTWDKLLFFIDTNQSADGEEQQIFFETLDKTEKMPSATFFTTTLYFDNQATVACRLLAVKRLLKTL